MSGTNTTIYINEEVKKLIKEFNINLSGFVNEELPKKYANLDYLRLEREELKLKLKDLDKQYNFLVKHKKKLELTPKVISAIKEMNNKLSINKNFFNGMFNRFREDFYSEISRSEFIELLSKYKPKENANRKKIKV